MNIYSLILAFSRREKEFSREGQIYSSFVIPAKAGIQSLLDYQLLDSGSPLRSAGNDGLIRLSLSIFARTANR